MSDSEAFEVADREELLLLLSQAARNGSVSAMKALLDELRRDGDDEGEDDGFAALDNVTPIRKGA